jgi:hypothetical protein
VRKWLNCLVCHGDPKAPETVVLRPSRSVTQVTPLITPYKDVWQATLHPHSASIPATSGRHVVAIAVVWRVEGPASPCLKFPPARHRNLRGIERWRREGTRPETRTAGIEPNGPRHPDVTPFASSGICPAPRNPRALYSRNLPRVAASINSRWPDPQGILRTDTKRFGQGVYAGPDNHAVMSDLGRARSLSTATGTVRTDPVLGPVVWTCRPSFESLPEALT